MSIFTITSDLGKDNYLSAIVQACIYEKNSTAKIIEISNELFPFDVYQAGYMLTSSLSFFPAKTHHFVLCGLYNHTIKKLLVCEYNNQYIYFVDNGFASISFESMPTIYEIKTIDTFEYNIGNIAKTFAMAASLINTNIPLKEFTQVYKLQYTPKDLSPKETNNTVTAQVLYIDRFKNVVINLTKAQFENYRNNRRFKIHIISTEEVSEISNGYDDVRFGHVTCFFNTSGYLEVAVRGGTAADLLGFDLGEKMEEIYRTVKIEFFEND
jgi:S-adenosyl-L-methionine hydrolase (adenosine-forming)